MAKSVKCPKCDQECRALDQGADGTLWLCQNEECEEFDEVVKETMP